MCGRVAQKISSRELASLFGAQDLAQADGERYNVAPTDPMMVVVERDGRRAVESFRWGLVPFWAESLKSGSKMINARAESIGSSRAFRESFERRRCLVPVAGFYEWLKRADGSRQAYYISRRDGSPLVFAGLWAAWRPPDGNAAVRTSTIVTTSANELMAGLHDRMPVILPPEALDEWLDPYHPEPARLRGLLRPYHGGDLTAHAVSSLVNRPVNQGPELIVPIATG